VAATCDCKSAFPTKVLKLTAPAHRPVKRSTLSHILKQARLTLDEFLELL
jgi:hypothetical protein